jgi:hypothetical protein
VLKPGGELFLAEIDRACKLDTLRTLMANSRVPRILQRAALPFLRTFIAGQAMDLDEFRELLASVAVVEGRVARVPGQPGILMTGRRDPQSSAVASCQVITQFGSSGTAWGAGLRARWSGVGIFALAGHMRGRVVAERG